VAVTGIKDVLFECAVVAICGALIGLGANAVSPRGLKLGRNYFPPPAPETQQSSMPSQSVPNTGSTNAAALQPAPHGFSLVESNYVAEAFDSPERALNLLIFVDARDAAHYQRGHIPGAYLLDYYRPEAHLPTVLPAAFVADRIIVYCNGGDCEDSQLAASLLRDSGVPREKLHLYTGGFMEWSTNGLPVEIGARNSQQLLQR
jgi:rhodanese-related sulfurtransferase